MQTKRFFVVILFTLQLGFPSLTVAAEFNQHLILTDADLTAAGTMTANEIENFFTLQKSGLANRVFTDTDGKDKTAAQIIIAAAEEDRINPRYILVMLQKEQSLISAQNPTQKQLDWATGYGVCDSCSMDDPAIQKFRGFAVQVRRAAGIMRYYYDNLDQSWIKRSGTSYSIDNTAVIPQSNATAFLYTYTPHIQGNKNFWKIWSNWFIKVFPEGSLVQPIDDKIVYLIHNGLRQPIASKAVLASRYNPELILPVSPSDLSAYTLGPVIKFPNYTVAKSPSGMLFLLVDEVKRPIASTAVFKTIGFNPDEVVEATDTDLSLYEPGTFITTASIYPLGAVAQDKKSKTLYYIKDGYRSVITSADIIKANFPKKKILTLDIKELAKYPLTSEAITFRDGTLLMVKGNPKVYVVSEGRMRPIQSEAVFNSLGYKWSNIITTDEQTFITLPPGEPLTDIATPTKVAAR